MKRKLMISVVLVSFLEAAIPFRPFDVGDSVSLSSIKTQVVNQKFRLYFMPYNGIFADYRLYDMDRDTNLTNWKHFDPTSMSNWIDAGMSGGAGIFFDDFIVNRAAKRVKVQFRFCQSKDAPGIPVPLQNCEGRVSVGGSASVSTSIGSSSVSGTISNSGISFSSTTSTTEGSATLSGSASTEYEYNTSVFSSDDFAIRPAKFEFVNLPQKIKAGEEFNITVEAVDINGNPVKDYNETLSLNNSPELAYQLTKSGCNLGKLEIVDGGNFKDGVAQVKLKYNEVGNLELTLKEVVGSEFAKVDSDDTPQNIRLIGPDVNYTESVPYTFGVSVDFKNYSNGKFTYISNDLNMSSELDVNVTALNKDNEITKNYNSKCYAKNVDLNITNHVDGNIATHTIYSLNGITNSANVNDNLLVTIPASDFKTDNNGSAQAKIKINFEKDYRHPVREFNMTITDINISDGDITKTISVNKYSTFRYGMIDMSNVCTSGKEANVTVIYNYWTDRGWRVNKYHSDIFGKMKSYLPVKDINVTLDSAINSGNQNITITTTHSLPYFVKIHLAIPSWLWYHPLAKPYKDPDSNNLDCLTHPCLNVGFNGSLRGWGGIGITPSKYDTRNGNRSVHIDSSDDIKANKLEIKKLNW